ncbi:hypothetical protein GLYMA_15G225866v4 [Glycine max]|nr:hypothetical protein GLYMA_15G225866v4 [Glycine max]KAH1148448.1 hypothetical protein GYH30_043187 [Glycine max]
MDLSLPSKIMFLLFTNMHVVLHTFVAVCKPSQHPFSNDHQ